MLSSKTVVAILPIIYFCFSRTSLQDHISYISKPTGDNVLYHSVWAGSVFGHATQQRYRVWFLTLAKYMLSQVPPSNLPHPFWCTKIVRYMNQNEYICFALIFHIVCQNWICKIYKVLKITNICSFSTKVRTSIHHASQAIFGNFYHYDKKESSVKPGTLRPSLEHVLGGTFQLGKKDHSCMHYYAQMGR